MDTNVLEEIEKLRRASLAELQARYRRSIRGRHRVPASRASVPQDRLAGAGAPRREI